MRKVIEENAMNRPPLPPFTVKHDDELRLFRRCRVNADVKAVQKCAGTRRPKAGGKQCFRAPNTMALPEANHER